MFSLLEGYGGDSEYQGRAATEGNLARRLAFMSLGAYGAVSLIRRRSHSLRMSGPLGWLVLSFVSWALLSLTWTTSIALTVRRATVLLFLLFGAVAVARKFSAGEIIRLALFGTSLYLVAGLITELILGTFRPLAPDYRFAGTLHPNNQGLNCALLVLSSVAVGRAASRARGYLFAWAAIGFGFLVLTRSRAAFASGVLVLLCYWALVSRRPRQWAVFVGVSMLLCVCLLIWGDTLFTALGRGILLGREDTVSTLTGRLPLWNECLANAQTHPILGHGYGSFWSEEQLYAVSSEQEWMPVTCHSAYIDVVLDLGVVGLGVYILILLTAFGRAVAEHRASSCRSESAFSVALLLLCTLGGLLESVIIFQPIYESFLGLATVVLLAFRGDKRVLKNGCTEPAA